MFEIVLLIAAVVGISSFARGRGGNPWLWGTLTVVGYFLFPAIITFLLGFWGQYPKESREDMQFLFFVASISWVALVAFCARFLLGSKHAQPGGMWSCPHCRYLNQPYAVVCEACRQPYSTKPQAAP